MMGQPGYDPNMQMQQPGYGQQQVVVNNNIEDNSN